MLMKCYLFQLQKHHTEESQKSEQRKSASPVPSASWTNWNILLQRETIVHIQIHTHRHWKKKIQESYMNIWTFFYGLKKKVFFNKIKCNLQYFCVRINVESGALLFLCFIEILKMKNTTEVRRKHKRSYLKVVEILQRLLWHCQGSWLNVNQTSISHGIVFNFLEKKSQLCCEF